MCVCVCVCSDCVCIYKSECLGVSACPCYYNAILNTTCVHLFILHILTTEHKGHVVFVASRLTLTQTLTGKIGMISLSDNVN